MADQRIKINIGSSYDGAGMAKAMGGLNSLSQTAGRASSAIGSLAGSFGGLDGAAGKAVGAVSKLTGALAMGGPVGIAVAGVTALVGAFQSYKEEQEKAAKATEETAKKVEELQAEAAKKAWNEFVTDLTNGRIEAEKLATKLDKVIQLTNEFSSAQQGSSNSKMSLEVAKIAADTSVNVEKAETPEEKNAIQTKGDLKAVQITAKMNVSTAETEKNKLTKTRETLEKSYNELIAAHDKLEQQANDLVQNWKEQNKAKIQEIANEDKLNAKKLSDMKTDEQIVEELMKKDAAFQKEMQAIRDEQKKTDEAIQTSGTKIATLRAREEAAQNKLTETKIKAAADEEKARIKMEKAQNALREKQIDDEQKAADERQRQRDEAEQAETDNWTAKENADREALKAKVQASNNKEQEERAKQREVLMQQLKAVVEKMRRTNAADTQTLKDLEVQSQQIAQRILDTLDMTKEEIMKKNLAVAVNVDGGGGNNGGGNGDGGSLFDPAGGNQPNGGFMPWERNRNEGPAANNNDNANWTDFTKPKGWNKRNANTHRNLWKKRGWDPDTGKPLAEEKNAKVNLADQTINKLKNAIKDAQQPHIAH